MFACLRWHISGSLACLFLLGYFSASSGFHWSSCLLLCISPCLAYLRVFLPLPISFPSMVSPWSGPSGGSVFYWLSLSCIILFPIKLPVSFTLSLFVFLTLCPCSLMRCCPAAFPPIDPVFLLMVAFILFPGPQESLF